MAQLENVTVNGCSVKEYLDREKSREVAEFLRDELKMFGRCCRHQLSSRNGDRNRTRVVDVGNGSIRFKVK